MPAPRAASAENHVPSDRERIVYPNGKELVV